MRLPRRGSFTETLLTSLVLTAAAICWINELLGDGPLGVAGLVLVFVVVGWVWRQRTGTLEAPDRPFLLGGTVALLLGVAFQLLSNRF